MKPETQHRYVQHIDRVIGYLNQQADAIPSLQNLADVAGISPYHFNRVYRAVTGETPFGTLRRLRLVRAAVMLKDSQKPITEIAFDVGYESSQAFSKAFRETTGFNASNLRRNPENLATVISALSKPPAQASIASLEVKVVSVAPFKVLAHRHTGPHKDLFETYGSFYQWIEQSGIADKMRGIYGIPIDDVQGVPECDCRFDCCFDLGPDATPASEYRDVSLGGGTYAVAHHVGPYEGLEDKYDFLYGTWLKSSNRMLREGPTYNHYLADPGTLPPEKWETDIYMPIEEILANDADPHRASQ